jgi:hypothetical protein
LTLGIACAFVNISYEKTEPIEQPSFVQSKPTLFLGREAGDSKTPHDCCMTTGFAEAMCGPAYFLTINGRYLSNRVLFRKWIPPIFPEVPAC